MRNVKFMFYVINSLIQTPSQRFLGMEGLK